MFAVCTRLLGRSAVSRCQATFSKLLKKILGKLLILGNTYDMMRIVETP